MFGELFSELFFPYCSASVKLFSAIYTEIFCYKQLTACQSNRVMTMSCRNFNTVHQIKLTAYIQQGGHGHQLTANAITTEL